MGGRVQGFLGGVLVTSSLAYLTALQFRTNQQLVSESLSRSQQIIEDRNKEEKKYVRGSRSIDYLDRSSIRETFADIWNREIIKGVNWLYGINWMAAGEKLEKKLVKLGSKVSDVKDA